MFKVVVGSRVQGLDGPDSDMDVKGVFAAPFAALCNPFQPLPNGIGGRGNDRWGVDEYIYELQHFCKLASACNPTVLETLYSNLVLETSPLGDELRANADRFINGWTAKQAFEGYARQQALRMQLDKQQDVQVISEQIAKHGNPKPLVHRLRILEQGLWLAAKGEFKLQSTHKAFLRRLKFNPDQPTVAAAIMVCQDYVKDLGSLTRETVFAGTQDKQWIADFCKRAYLEDYEKADNR